MPFEPSAHENNRLQTIERARRVVFGDGSLISGTHLEPWIERSWRRCLAQGLRPQQRIGFNAVSRAAIDHAREANQPLLRAAAPVIRSLTRTMADTGYFAILTDAQGVVILARLNNGFATFPTSRSTRGGPLPLKDLQEVMIRKAVEDARGNVMEAARVLGISRATVYRKLQRRSSVDQAQEGADPG